MLGTRATTNTRPRFEKEMNFPVGLISLIEVSWQQDPKKRPDFDLMHSLHKIEVAIDLREKKKDKNLSEKKMKRVVENEIILENERKNCNLFSIINDQIGEFEFRDSEGLWSKGKSTMLW